jgi:hypothetical protein
LELKGGSSKEVNELKFMKNKIEGNSHGVNFYNNKIAKSFIHRKDDKLWELVSLNVVNLVKILCTF